MGRGSCRPVAMDKHSSRLSGQRRRPVRLRPVTQRLGDVDAGDICFTFEVGGGARHAQDAVEVAANRAKGMAVASGPLRSSMPISFVEDIPRQIRQRASVGGIAQAILAEDKHGWMGLAYAQSVGGNSALWKVGAWRVGLRPTMSTGDRHSSIPRRRAVILGAWADEAAFAGLFQAVCDPADRPGDGEGGEGRGWR
jgi:hypothetical protein